MESVDAMQVLVQIVPIYIYTFLGKNNNIAYGIIYRFTSKFCADHPPRFSCQAYYVPFLHMYVLVALQSNPIGLLLDYGYVVLLRVQIMWMSR
jgi:hypothetical protein